jgi:hypothetical protein
MEIAVISGALFLLGKNILKTKIPRQTENKNDIKETNLGFNIYNSNGTKILRQREQNILDKRFEAAKDPKRTNIINPATITQECGFDCAYKEPMYTMPKILPENKGCHISPIFETPSYLADENSLPNTMSGENIVMTHNNMKPHFKGSLKQNMTDNLHERRIEAFTGSINSTTIEKTPTENFFKPVKQQTTPGIFNLDKSRYVTSRFNQHVKPMPEVREIPIPSSVLRPIFKTIDQLRVLPREVYKNVSNLGQKAKLFNSNVNNTVVKDKTFRDERNGNNLSVNKKDRMRENFDICKTEFGETNYTGVAFNKKMNYNHEAIVSNEKDTTRHSNFIRNISMHSKPSEIRDSVAPVETQRETTSNYFSGIAVNTNRGIKLYENVNVPTTLKECNLYDYNGNRRGFLKSKNTDFVHNNNTKREAEYFENLPQGPKINNNHIKPLLKTDTKTQFRLNTGLTTTTEKTKPKHSLVNRTFDNNRIYPELVSGLKSNELSIYRN